MTKIVIHDDHPPSTEEDKQVAISIPTTPDAHIKSPPQIVKYDPQEVYILEKRFQRLHRDSARLLTKSQRYKKYAMRIKLVIVIFSLATSYLTAISGINETVKTYLATAFSLFSAILSGASTIKNYSADASKLYTGFMEYQQKASLIEPIFHHFRGTIPYSELIESIDTLFTKYEFDIDKSYTEKVANAEKRLVYIFEILEEKIRQDNGGSLPEWYTKKRILETHLDKYSKKNTSLISQAMSKDALGASELVPEKPVPPSTKLTSWFTRWFASR